MNNKGASPHRWGRPMPRPVGPAGGGTIPTQVGHTVNRRYATAHTSDHPHAGGVHLDQFFSPELDEGPSPRGRGRPLDLNSLI